MKHLTTGLCFAALLTGMASCAGDEGFEGVSSEQGGIALSLTTDGRVMRQTRADDGVSPVVPGASDFGITLAKSDGTYSKSWNNLDLFNRETSFGIGDYDLTASYGDPDKEGYEAPYYMGKTQVHVSPGATTEANVVATLANAMVSIRYTDAFTANFPAYSAAVQTEGHEWVVFAQNETRPAYIAPTDVKLNLTLTNDAGKQVTIQPAGFKAEARHHYVVTIGVTENSGNLALDVVFDDEVVSETVSVSLGDDLFNAPAPTVTPKGFEPTTEASTYEYADYSGDAQFDVIAFGGIKGVTLNIVSDNGYAPTFGKSVELVNASDVLRTQLETEGVECGGLFRNVDKMAAVNLKKFLSNLPAGKYKVELQAVDLMTRTTEPVAFALNVQPLVTSLASAGNVEFLGTEVSIDLSTNCEGIRDNVSFKVPNANGQMVNAHVKSVTAVKAASGARTRADLPYTFRYVLGMEQVTKNVFNVEVAVGKKAPEQVAVTVSAPDYEVVADAFARKVVFKIEAENEDIVNYVSDKVQIYNGGTAVPTSNISHNGTGFITIDGLTAATAYDAFKFTVSGFDKDVAAFTTETETQVPNGDFSQLGTQYRFDKIQCGGQWNISGSSWYRYTNYTNINRYAPAGWATKNDLTCWSESSNKNTWFLVPSTYVENNSAVIATVGYNHNGATPDQSGSGNKYYCTNAPSSLSKSAGEMFLGSYTFDGTEHRTDNIDFQSRPTTLDFDYKYIPFKNESGEVVVKVYAADGTVIAEKKEFLGSSQDRKECSIALTGYPFGKKASKIYIGFKSSTSDDPGINIPVGDALNEGVSYRLGQQENWVKNDQNSANAYNAVAKGSELTLYNVRLGYDPTSAVRSISKARVAGKRR